MNNIIITPSDKRKDIVIMDSTDYNNIVWTGAAQSIDFFMNSMMLSPH